MNKLFTTSFLQCYDKARISPGHWAKRSVCFYMATFLIGLVILFVGAALYGKFCEKVFGPDDRETPAYSKQDGVDYVPMRCWKNSLINLLNIAGPAPSSDPSRASCSGPSRSSPSPSATSSAAPCTTISPA